MKKLVLIILILVGSTALAQEPITINPKGFVWDAVVDSDLAGYKLYISTEQGTGYSVLDTVQIADLADPANPNYNLILENLPDDQYYSVVTAFDKVGNESAFSNEVTFIVDKTPPGTPGGYNCAGGITININILGNQ